MIKILLRITGFDSSTYIPSFSLNAHYGPTSRFFLDTEKVWIIQNNLKKNEDYLYLKVQECKITFFIKISTKFYIVYLFLVRRSRSSFRIKLVKINRF